MCQTIVRMPLLFFWKGKMTAVIQDNKKNWQEKVLKWNRASSNIRLLSKKNNRQQRGRQKGLVGKIRKLPFALKLCSPYTCFFGMNFLLTIISSILTLSLNIHTLFLVFLFLIASREIRDRTSGQGWASNRDSGNYPHHRYISDSPEQERVLIQVITTHICI